MIKRSCDLIGSRDHYPHGIRSVFKDLVSIHLIVMVTVMPLYP